MTLTYEPSDRYTTTEASPTGSPPGSPRGLLDWSGTQQIADAEAVRHPRSLGELRDLLSSSDRPIRVLGNRFSTAALLRAPGTLALDMRHFVGVLHTTPSTVVVAGNTSIAQVHTHLKRIGRRIDCSPPVIAEQSVAGAIGTGTHGQGASQSTIGDAVQTLWVMGPSGHVERITRHDSGFGAHIMHLGVLGIIILVELRTVPNRIYVCEKAVLEQGEFLREFPRLNAAHEFCKAWWFPQHRKAHVWMLRPVPPPEPAEHLCRHGDQTGQTGQTGRSDIAGHPGPSARLASDAMDEVVDHLVERLKIDTRTIDLRQDQFRTVERFRDAATTTGDLYDLLCKGIPVPQINCEIGIPFEAFTEAQTALTRWYEREAPTIHYPLILRGTGPSEAWLSAAHERPTLHYGTVVYRAADGTHEASALASMHSVQKILRDHHGRTPPRQVLRP